MFIRRPIHLKAFTLIELSIVVLVLALLAAAAMRYINSTNDATFLATTNNTLDVVEAALQNFRNTYGRLPCPADLTAAENVTSSNTFGTEIYAAATGGALGDGNCGYISSSNENALYTNSKPGIYINTGTDPDASGGTDPGAPDANYDSATASQVVQGAIPTKTLRLADRYAYDAWGNKIFYAVDRRITATNAFTTYTVTSTGTGTVGAVVVKKTATDTLANALTYKGLYALVSTGKNGHGGYPRNLTSAVTTRFNAGSINADELDNCHCTNGVSAAVTATAFNRIFVQKPKTVADTTVYNNTFDDIVRFKTRLEMANSTEMK